MNPTDMLLAVVMVAQLGSPYFPVRHRADQGLLAMGERAVPVLTLYADSRDPEVRLRVGRLLDARRSEAFTALLSRYAVLPWLDALPDDHPDRCDALGRNLYLARALRDGLPVEGHWPEYRLATRLWIAEQSAAGVPLATIRRTLDRMAQRSVGWDGNSPPPVEVPELLPAPKAVP